jgi:hypothetical protein
MVGHMLQADILPYALKAKQDDIKMGTYNLTKPSLVFYQQKQVVYTPKLHEEDQLTEFLNTNPPFERLMYLVVRKSEVEELNRIYPLELVNSGYVYSLVRVRNFPIDKDSNQ